MFTGNTNNNGIVYNWLTVSARARFVRFRATDVSGNHICARLEFYGSKDSQGMIGFIHNLYSMIYFKVLQVFAAKLISCSCDFKRGGRYYNILLLRRYF